MLFKTLDRPPTVPQHNVQVIHEACGRALRNVLHVQCKRSGGGAATCAGAAVAAQNETRCLLYNVTVCTTSIAQCYHCEDGLARCTNTSSINPNCLASSADINVSRSILSSVHNCYDEDWHKTHRTYFCKVLPRVQRIEVVELAPQLENLIGLNSNVTGLPLEC